MECPACQHPNVDGARFCAKCGAPLPTPTSDEDPLIGSIVGGRYRITAILGEGGMGRVYTAEQQMGTTVRKAAVKTLLAQYAKDPQVLARFNRECGTVAELEHPNTIKVYDFGQTNTGELYIAMELLVGTSLEEAIEKGGAMMPDRVERIIGQAAGSLQEAHDKGIVHRDLKPANIFLTKRAGEDDYVKVLDFGIAKRAERPDSKEQKLTQQGTVLGTPPYMSPEQFRGQELDARSDIYSLAVVTYEMLTGRLPFDADTPWAWATQHLTAQPFPFEITPVGANVPPKMRTAILRGLEKDRNKRQASVKQFFEELSLGGARAGAPITGQQAAYAGAGMAMPGMPSGQMHAMPSGQMHSMPSGPLPQRPGGTQIGEPLFVQQPQQPMHAPPGRTVVDTGQSAAMSMTPQPMPAMQTQQQPMYGPAGVMANPAYPAPPPPQAAGKPSSNMMPIVAGIAVLTVLGIIGVIFAFRGGKSGDGEVLTLPSATTPTAVVVASDSSTTSGNANPDPASSGATNGTAAGGSTSSGSGSTASTTTSKPTPSVDPKADAACDAAISLARGTNTSLAIAQYRSCAGPKRSSALAAIDASAAREVQRKKCAAKAVANQAAAIGASSGKNALPPRCP